MNRKRFADVLFLWLNDEWMKVPTNQQGSAGAKNKGKRVAFLMVRNKIIELESSKASPTTTTEESSP